MKRWIAILLAAVLLLALAGCGGSPAPAGTVTADPDGGGTVRGSVVGPEAGEDAGESAEEPEADLADEPEDEPEEEPDEEPDEELEPGVVAGGVYENEFIGIGLRLDDSWTFADEAEIQELNGTAADLTNDEEMKEILDNAATFTDMFASADDGLVSITVQMENLGVLYGTLMDESAYADAGMSSLEDYLSSVDMFSEYTVEKSTVELAGQERVAIRVHEVMDESVAGEPVDIYQTEACLKSGRYMTIITMTSYFEDITDELAGYFYDLAEGPAEEPAAAPEEAAAPDLEPVHFLDAMGSDGTPAYIDLIGVSDWVYRDGGRRYYAAEDEDYFYIICVDDDLLAEMEEQQVYWDREEDADEPPVYHLVGCMGTVDSDTREAFKEVFEIDDEDFDYYFGDDYLDAAGR